MQTSPRPSLTRRSARLLAFVALAACSDATGPGGAPHEVTLSQSGDLRAVAGDHVPELYAVVKDVDGRPVPRVDVRITADGGGTVSPVESTTDARGQVRIVWRVGMESKTQTLQVRAASLDPVSVTAAVEGRVTGVTLALPGDSVEVGDTIAMVAKVLDNFGDERADLPVLWTSSLPGRMTVDTAGRVAAVAEGESEVAATVRGVRGVKRVRAYDVPTALSIVPVGALAALVDVEDSLRLTTQVVGRTGRPMASAGPVTWSCSRSDVVARCDSVVRPRMVPLAHPETVFVSVAGAGLTGRLPVAIWEEPMTRMTVTWPPASMISMDTTRRTPVDATVGDTLRLLLETIGGEVGGVYPYRPDRPYRVSSSDPSVATVSLGGVIAGRRIVNVVGQRPGESVVRILVNGAGAALTARVAERRANACAPDRTIPLDLALGGAITVREGEAVQPRCLEFDRERDRDRVYLVVTDVLPNSTGRYPNAAGDPFGVEGQGLFFQYGLPEPMGVPTTRLYSPGWQPPLALRAAPAAPRETPAWIVDGVPLYEGALDTVAARRQANGLRVMAAGAPPIAAGDTIDLGGFAYFDPDIRTTHGDAVDTRIVVKYVGTRLVIAEMVDVVTERLRYSDGTKPGALSPSRYAELESAYEIPARQLARLFPGTPFSRTVLGRDMGTREMVVNVPLRPGIGGYASGEFVVMDYYSNGEDPRAIDIADGVLAHEFAHMRHISRYWPQGSTPPWLVEGVANFAERLAATARQFGTDTPSRLARATKLDNLNKLPGANINYTESFFSGYHAASYPLDYLADHVEAAGGDGLAAVRALAQHGGEARTADSVVAAAMPGLDVQSLYHRARTALAIEWQRGPGCSTCIAPDVALPEWTRYLQYDLPATVAFAPYDAQFWPTLTPGVSGGLTLTQRTGTFWPALIDGRGATADASWILDMSTAPQTTVTIVRIR
jgi:hypothetical protein